METRQAGTDHMADQSGHAAADGRAGDARRRRNAALLGLALGVLLGLFYSPRSRWIVVAHSARLLHPHWAAPDLPRPLATPASRASLALAADRTDRFAARLAVAALGAPSDTSASPDASLKSFAPALKSLKGFAGTPEALAVVLRHAAERRGDNPSAWGHDAAGFRDFIRKAELGEQRDAGNAFFPAMRAAALYAEGRSVEGRAALGDAAKMPAWRDAVPFEMHGAWEVSDGVYGKGNPAARAVMASAVELPRYPLLLRAARSAMHQSAGAERAGNAAEAAAIRRDVQAVGRLIRVQSTALPGSLAGAAIEEAAGQPGGREAVARVVVAGLERFDITKRLAGFNAWFVRGQAVLTGAAWAALFALLAGLTRAVTRRVFRGRTGRALAALSSAGLPLACALVLLYGAVTFQTLRQAASINRSLAALVQHEGRFYADLAGLHWPD